MAVIAAWPIVASAADPEPAVEACLKSSEEAQRLRDGGKYVRARELFAACAARSCPSVVQSECASALADLERSAPSIVFVVRNDADQDVANARIVVDGAPVAPRTVGTPLNVDAGEHVVRVEAAGHKTAEQRFVASAGEKSRVLHVRLARETPVVPAASGPSTSTNAFAPSADGVSSKRVIAITFGGLALVAAGTSIALGLGARSDLSDLEASPCGKQRTCKDDDVDAIRSRLVVADVALGVAAAATVGAVWLWLSDDRPSTRLIGVAVRPNSIGLGGRF